MYDEDRLKVMVLLLPSLLYRRLCVATYKYLHDHNDSSYHSVSPNTGVTNRGHFETAEKRRRTAVRGDFSSYRIANVWNSLPELVMTAGSVNSFEGRFDKFCS